jgi:streptogramin lyase
MFSYIWIANSSEGTVSKINTQTGVEEGRYYTYPTQGSGNPSRTSVNLVGDVAVSNREPGGITKVAAELSRCDDRNNDGMIQTSTGPGDVLPWMQDECVLWHLPLPTTQYNYGARPTAWEGGNVDDNGCLLDTNPRLWIGYKDEVTQQAVFLRIDGASGTILDTIDGPVWQGISSMGPYGGAVNADGDFIVSGLNYGNVIHIDSETLQLTEITDVPQDKYGMGLDADGNIWVGGYMGNVHTYDFATDTWTTIAGVSSARVNGIMVDRNGYAWGARSGPCGLIQVDTTTNTVVNDMIPLPGCSSPWGVSIDVDGYVWVVDMGANRAFKVDPVTHAVQLEVTGLVSPYTYSDMTGAGLNLVVNPPG